MPLSLEGLRHRYGPREVLHGVDLELADGVIGCLLGGSGCGKTTLLRCIAGFEPVTAGHITLNGELLSSPGVTRDPARRDVGLVFQDGALFPHLNVADNVAFGLRGLQQPMRRQRVTELLELVGLAGYREAMPDALSGGQKQRVALARALAPAPGVVLLDEPFANLDRDLRRRLAVEVRDLLRSAGTTALLVTHDQEEAFTLADEVGVMDGGRIVQWDTPAQLYTQPVSRRVAALTGDASLLAATVTSDGNVDTPLGSVSGAGLAAGSEVELLLRPDDVVPAADVSANATVRQAAFRGAHTLYTLQLDAGGSVLVSLPSGRRLRAGDRLGLALAAKQPVLFPAGAG